MPHAVPILALTTADDVFKSMNETMTAPSEVTPVQVLLAIAAIVGLAVLISVFNKRSARPAKPVGVNNPAKLLRELCREAGLKRSEIRELKKLAQLQGVEHPLTLLLCPSLMQAAIAKRRAQA